MKVKLITAYASEFTEVLEKWIAEINPDIFKMSHSHSTVGNPNMIYITCLILYFDK